MVRETPVRVFFSYRNREFSDLIPSLIRNLSRSGLPIKPLVLENLREDFGVSFSSTPIFEEIVEYIKLVDIVVVLIAAEYSKWVTQEYEAAFALNKPVLVFVKNASSRDAGLASFLQQALPYIHAFDSWDELEQNIKSSIENLLIKQPHHFNIALQHFPVNSIQRQELAQELDKLEPARNLCFVMMPIGKQNTKEYQLYKNIYERMIKPAVELDEQGKPTGLICKRADEENRTGSILKQIIESIVSAEIVIADLTSLNPNVFYELGVRHSLKRKTILIAREGTELPFDIANYRTIFYDPTIGFIESAIANIRLRVKAYQADNNVKDSPVMDWTGYR
jgi:hypothetical protein